MSQMDSRQTIPYGRKNLNDPQPHQTITNSTHTYYPITDQLQYVESRIVTQNNSSLVSAINLNPNKLTVYQRSLQFQHEHLTPAHQNHVFNIQNHHQTHRIGNNHQPTHKLSRPGSNKITATNENHSSICSQQRSQQQSLNKRPVSVTRGGIRVVSRNSSMEKKSQTSVQKSITSKDLNTGKLHMNQQKTTNIPLCGLNCTTRTPFTQNEQTNQMTVVPNLGSLQTLKSGITSSHLPYSQRQHLNHRNPSQQKLNKNFYDNISQRTHIQPGQNYLQKNHSELMKQNLSLNGNNIQKVYKQVRQMMEKEIHVAKKMYEKKYLDQIQSLNTYYKSQIQTLQKVLAENLTVIQQQGSKITKLQDKLNKKQEKSQKYSQRFQSLIKFIQKSNKFALQRIDQVQRKFILLLSEFQSFHLSPSDSIALQNKLSYLQQVFSTMLVKTITKYRSIECEIKEEIKEMMKKYDFYEEKIYEMDLMKHLGKENQIQNYRLIQSIEGIKEKLVILESKANMRSQIRELNKEITIGSESMSNETRNLHKIEELKRVISAMQLKLGNLEQEAAQTSIKMYKFENIKTQLQNKVPILQKQLSITKKELIQIRTQRDQVLALKQHLLAQNQKHQQQRINQLQQKGYTDRSPQKGYQNVYNFDLSSQKKSLNNQRFEGNNERNNKSQFEIRQMKRQVQRLQQIIEQYEAKMQQLHEAIDNLEKQNSVLITALKNNSKNEQKENHTTQRKLNHQKEHEQSIDKAIIQRLNKQLQDKNQLVQQLQFSIQQVTREKQQLQQALETTEKIFDQQISKFKQTIRLLQQQNSNLLTQISQLLQGQYLEKSGSSTKSNIQKVTLAKSPKKEMCQTVTMNWFKKNVSNQQKNQQKIHSISHNSNVYDSYQKTLNNINSTNKSSPLNLKSNLSSPINYYNADNNYKIQNKSNPYQYTDQIKQHSSNTIYHQSPQGRDQFFYPQSIKNNLNSKRSIDSTSIMQSHPNIAPYHSSQNSNNHNLSNLSQQRSLKTSNTKEQTHKVINRYQTSNSYHKNRYQHNPHQDSYKNQYHHQQQQQQQQNQEEETQTYIF